MGTVHIMKFTHTTRTCARGNLFFCVGNTVGTDNISIYYKAKSDYVKRPVLSATIHPDLKRTLVAMSKRTGMSVSQVTDEVLYTGLVDMQEMDEL